MPIDMSMAATSTAKAPPRKTASTRVSSRAAQAQESQSILNQQRTEGLIGLAQLGQGLLVMAGLYADAAAIGKHFPPLAKETANVADHYDVVAKPLDYLIQVGPFGALIATAMPLALQLAANHRLVDGSRLTGQGVVPPEVLEAQMKAEVARMQSDAMRAQQLAMKEAMAAQKEYEDLTKVS